MAGLYIHIPFCATKCPYCDFYSLPARPADMDAYHTVLLHEIARAGFHQYEISNFARPGFESRHNLKYWRREEYLGFGPAAHSFYQGKRYAHPRDLAGYLASDGTNTVLTDFCENQAAEELMLRLRLTEGADLAALFINSAARQAVLAAARPLEQAGLLAINQTHIALTPRGFLVSNAIILRLTEAMEQTGA